MKRVKSLSIILLALIILGTSVGVFNGKTKKELEYQLLSLKDVTGALAQNKVRLVPRLEELPRSVFLEGVKPYTYQIANTQDWLFIYVFDSHEERYSLNTRLNKMELRERFLPFGQISVFSEAKNVLIVYSPKNFPLKAEDPVSKRVKAIENAVFTDLNKGHTLVFRGEGHLWEAQVIYRYTSSFFKDSKGVLRVDSWGTDTGMARYKGRKASEFGPVSLTIMEPHGSSHGTGIKINSNGIVRFGSMSSNVLNAAKDIYTITIEWSGQRETFNLKAHSDPFVLFPY